MEGCYRHNLGEAGRTSHKRSIATAESKRVPADRVSMDKTHWMRVMAEGQLTRDPVLKTRSEVEEDRRRARALEARRKVHCASGEAASPSATMSRSKGRNRAGRNGLLKK